MREKLKIFIENKHTNNFILAVIIYNAIALGLLTYPTICQYAGNFLHQTCFACVIIFTIEMLIKLYVYGKNFFKDGWNNFDFILVAISWVPTGGAFSSFRAFRVLRALRALRLIVRLRRLRIIVQAIIESIPNVAWACLLLVLIYYIFAIMGTTMYAEAYPQYYGSIGKTMFTLFQVMTLDDWGFEFARPMMETYPSSWLFYLSFILTSSFIVLNVIVGVIVNAIGEISDRDKSEQHSSDIEVELTKLKEQITVVENLLKKQ